MWSLIDNDTISAVSKTKKEGYVYIEGAVCGMLYDGEKLSSPKSTDEQKIFDIDSKLEELDNKSKRPMRAILTASEGTDTSKDLALLSEYEAQAVALRSQRAELVE